VCLTPMAYQWCSVISENMRTPERDGDAFLGLFYTALAIGFRQIGPDHTSDTRLACASHHDLIFEIAFASEDDEIIADAISVWVVDPLVTPPGSSTRRLAKLIGRERPLSLRLRQTIVRSIQRHWLTELEAAGFEFVVLLNHLEVDVEDTSESIDRLYWVSLLAGVLGSLEGQKRLSFHYWILLGNLISMGARLPRRSPNQDVEIMRSLEDSGDWEKLEPWLLTIWGSWYTREAIPMEDIERATLKLFSQRSTTIRRFEDVYAQTPAPYASLFRVYGDQFRRIRDKARAESSS
jgi:hypothetical protein